MKRAICLLFVLYSFQLNAQTDYSNLGKAYRFSSAYSMFPDSVRNKQPRVYQGKTFTAQEHYSDSSVFIFIPNSFDKNRAYELVLWFHGWNNNIDSALKTFHLVEQFAASNRNAIFVFPEGPKNSPDSYGGKFEQPNNFDLFIKDIQQKLVSKNSIEANTQPSLILAGHSGAYNVISHILQHASITTKGILLFDALYGQQKVFADYVEQHKTCTFIHVYTDSGGTYNNSLNFLKDITTRKLLYRNIEHSNLTDDDIQLNRILFIHSNLGHNEILSKTNYFKWLLQFME
jgi:hypothetical protein